jgi:hypothetical protein
LPVPGNTSVGWGSACRVEEAPRSLAGRQAEAGEMLRHLLSARVAPQQSDQRRRGGQARRADVIAGHAHQG